MRRQEDNGDEKGTLREKGHIHSSSNKIREYLLTIIVSNVDEHNGDATMRVKEYSLCIMLVLG